MCFKSLLLCDLVCGNNSLIRTVEEGAKICRN